MAFVKRVCLFCFIFIVGLGFTIGVSSRHVCAAKIELSLAHEAPATFVYQTLAESFKTILEKKVGDKVTVKIFHSGQLGGEKDTLEGEKIGTVDMALVASSLLALWEPQMAYIDIPFLYRDIDHAQKVLNGPIGESINKKLEKHGIMVLACTNLGYRGVFNRKQPIYKVADAKGMKYRVIQNPVYVDLVNSWGAKATPMNWGEIYTALQQGVLDAADADPYSYEIMKFNEVAPYFSITNHVYQATPLTMSKKKFDSLPADIQKAIKESATSLIPEAIKITKDIDYRIIGKLVRENKISFNTANIAAFEKASKAVSDKYSQKIGMDVIEKIKAVK